MRQKDMGRSRLSAIEQVKLWRSLRSSAPEALIWMLCWSAFGGLSLALSQTRAAGWDERWGMASGFVFGAGCLIQGFAAVVVIVLMLLSGEPEPEGYERWSGRKPSAREAAWGWAAGGLILLAFAGSCFGRFGLGQTGLVSGWAWAAEAACLSLDAASVIAGAWLVAATPREIWREAIGQARRVTREEAPELERAVLDKAVKSSAPGRGARRL